MHATVSEQESNNRDGNDAQFFDTILALETLACFHLLLTMLEMFCQSCTLRSLLALLSDDGMNLDSESRSTEGMKI